MIHYQEAVIHSLLLRLGQRFFTLLWTEDAIMSFTEKSNMSNRVKWDRGRFSVPNLNFMETKNGKVGQRTVPCPTLSFAEYK